MKEAKNFFADDYGNLYLYKNKDFNFSKYDSLGKQLGQMRLTLPFKIQDIQNPLNIILFSENAQEIKLVDANLVEIQSVDLRRFGFIKMAYVEDQQQIWLLDESTKRLLQYRFRQDNILQAYQMYFDVENVKDMIVYKEKIYILSNKAFTVYNFKGEKLNAFPTDNGVRLRRENDEILLIGTKSIIKFNAEFRDKIIFDKENARIVDKNNSTYFEVNGNKIYLYPILKETEIITD
ncbi:hypothetical protein [Frigoriflavimonas asaccharolytica]|uniref:Uncharacterized protein n=1 Tax=Frigoriflavimonas asaccharolytica TaxID=2735899 RepID=A0A8J8G837_9FLAO|nr:hypothetical protein [Frigoriflavimonas asaccharolytica]NRS91677.1 hypothetical protein [Frigoriflavimonas asaccharolytica]